MSTFDHTGLIQNINENLVTLRKTQPEAMQAFGQLARVAASEGAISAKKQRTDSPGHWHSLMAT